MLQTNKQSKILLIHGFAQGVDFNPFKKPKKNEQIFPIFKIEIRQKQAIVFDWAMDWQVNCFDYLGSKNFHKLYFKEREKATDDNTLETLNRLITKQNPNLILAHSMGCFLLLNHFCKYQVNPNLTKICLVQADINQDYFLSKFLQERVIKKQLEIINLYCWWDPALIYSSVLHKKLRAGLIGWRQVGIKNKFLPLLDLPNPHEGILSNRKLVKILLG